MIESISMTFISELATALSLPLAVLVLWQSHVSTRRAQEYGTYDVLDEKYQDFLLLCFENLELGVYGAEPDFNEKSLGSDQAQQREILLLILISILERAYLMYRRRSKPMEKQWNGWNSYIDAYCASPSFARAWLGGLGVEFESEFVSFIERKINLKWPDLSALDVS